MAACSVFAGLWCNWVWILAFCCLLSQQQLALLGWWVSSTERSIHGHRFVCLFHFEQSTGFTVNLRLWHTVFFLLGTALADEQPSLLLGECVSEPLCYVNGTDKREVIFKHACRDTSRIDLPWWHGWKVPDDCGMWFWSWDLWLYQILTL